MSTAGDLARHVRGNLVAYIALFFALGLGGAWAAGLDKNSVKSKQVKNNTLKSQDLKNGKGVSGADVKADALGGEQIDEASLGKVPASVNADTADTADTAGDADLLGGLEPAAFQRGVRWVLVAEDGTIVDQSGGIDVDRPSDGQYYVDFNAPIAGRPLMGTVVYEGADDLSVLHVSPCGGDSAALEAGCDSQVPGADASGEHAFVFTHVTTGGGDDQPFYLALFP